MRSNNKVYDYVVVLKQKNRRSVELIGLMAFAVFLAILLYHLITKDQYRVIVGLITIAGLGLFASEVIDFKANKKPELMLPFLFSAIISVVLLKSPWIATPYLILALIYRRAVRPQEIGFSPEIIVVDGLFQKRINWSELNNVLIKDGLLTIDYKNNKLFQQETDDLDDDDDDEVTEEEFNAFCRTALHK